MLNRLCQNHFIGCLREKTARLFLVTIFLGPDQAVGSSYADAILKEATARELHRMVRWKKLMRYRTSIYGFKSEVDSPSFFLAKDGKYNPRAELEATIRSFFQAGDAKEPNNHPQCLYRSRYIWLKKMLQFDSTKMPEAECLEYKWWKERFSAKSITLVFASHYLSNPASMFGHLLLRINSNKKNGAPDLLNYGLNFGAVASKSDGILYYLKGVSGFYPGIFGLLPYYQKVQEYNNFESRDIFEYDLHFSESEIELLIAHIWEIQSHFFDYYFLDENCAYHILGLLEAAKPGLNITPDIFWADPGDIIRRLNRIDGLVSSRHYRPSILSKLRARISSLNEIERNFLQETIKYKQKSNLLNLEQLPEKSQAKVLDAVLDYLHYEKQQEDAGYSANLGSFQHNVLTHRSRLPGPSQFEHQPEYSSSPDLGQELTRLGFGGGFLDERYFAEVNLRPGYHDLLSNPTGYQEFTEIRALDTNLRYFPKNNSLMLESLTLYSVTLLAPISMLSTTPSYQVSFVSRPSFLPDCDYCRESQVAGSFGYSGFLYKRLILGFAMAAAKLGYSTQRKGVVGLGAISGIYWTLSPHLRLLVDIEGYREFRQEPIHFDYLKIGAGQNFSISTNLELEVTAKKHADRHEVKANLKVFF